MLKKTAAVRYGPEKGTVKTMELIRDTVTVGAWSMDYVRFGNGRRAFVILPGISLQSVLLSAKAVQAAYAACARRYTVYLFDRRKDFPPVYSVKQMTDDTAAAMRQLGVADADIFGASQGGMMALQLALEHPQLVHAAAIGSGMARPCDKLKAVFAQWIALAEAGEVRALNHSFFEKVYSPSTLEAVREQLPLLEAQGTPEDCVRFAILCRACLGFDLYDRLPEIRRPLLALGGRLDAVLTPEATEEIIRQTGCSGYIYEDFGHAVYDEASDYRERLLEFFSRQEILGT